MPPDLDLVSLSRVLAHEVARLRFTPPVVYVYNPLEYAWAPHEAYLRTYGQARGRTLLLGMNPGPFGMMQTGVPFGDVTLVREWLGLEAPVTRPAHEHPQRPIEGFACTRSEVSGSRLWGWARLRFGTPAAFFARFFVLNYCPLAFLEASGRNRTPDKLPVAEQRPLFEACDRALAGAAAALAPTHVVGIGGFATERARRVLGTSIPIGTMLHPSPASPRANRGWAEAAEIDLGRLGIPLP